MLELQQDRQGAGAAGVLSCARAAAALPAPGLGSTGAGKLFFLITQKGVDVFSCLNSLLGVLLSLVSIIPAWKH